ncbi:MAG: PD40 domain-containing protein [Anaerolineae bacterium]|nr:PD40 domain-containing protein [Anaerolineae bacterium]
MLMRHKLRRRRVLGLSLVLLGVVLACALLPGGTSTSEPATEALQDPTVTPERQPVCTPPPCREDEVYYCPDVCPGGCGTTCATPTPSGEPWEAPVPVFVYTVERNIWAAVGYNAPRQLTFEGLDSVPRLSPDGNWILFNRGEPEALAEVGPFALWVIGVDGSGARSLVLPEDLPGEPGTPAGEDEEGMLDRLPYQVHWLPDSSGVAFNTLLETGYGLLTKDDLWIATLESDAPLQLLPDGTGGAFAHAPAGDLILVADADSVAMANANGTDRREVLAFEPVNTASEYAYIPQPVWLPDGTAGLAAISSPAPFEPGAEGLLWSLPRSGAAERLATAPGLFLFVTMNDRAWSPDRQWLAYFGEDRTTLFLTSYNGATQITVATGVGQFLSWSPDSGQFAYSLLGDGNVMIGALDGASYPFPADEGVGPVWDVQWLDATSSVYVAGDYGDFTLWTGALDGEQRIIDVGVEDFDARLAP